MVGLSVLDDISRTVLRDGYVAQLGASE